MNQVINTNTTKDAKHLYCTPSAPQDQNNTATIITYNHSNTLAPPPLYASPSDIQLYLTALIQKTRGFSPEKAGSIAVKWNKGSGRELKVYPAEMYSEVFRVKDGWVAYKAVKSNLRRWEREHQEKGMKVYIRCGKCECESVE